MDMLLVFIIESNAALVCPATDGESKVKDRKQQYFAVLLNGLGDDTSAATKTWKRWCEYWNDSVQGRRLGSSH